MCLSVRTSVQSYILLVTLILLCGSPVVFAQTGQWVSHPNDVTGTDVNVYDCGETTACFSRLISSHLLFFDINGGAWVDEILPTTQTWDYLVAEGELALAVSDSFVVAYNGLTSTAHSLRFEGDRLRTQSYYWSYRCGKTLAYLVTDEVFYVFDSELDAWQQMPITIPGDFLYCHSGVSSDWVGVSLERTYGTAPAGYAYSLITHSFAQTDNGPLYGPTNGALDHGFVESNNVSTDLQMVAYSAMTNAFTRVTIPANYSLLQYGYSDQHGKKLRTVFSAVYGVSGADPRQHHFLGYDTRRGSWTEDLVTYDGAVYSYWNNLYKGGQFAVTVIEEIATDEVGFRVYSGIDGTITTYWPGIANPPILCLAGGTTFLAAERNSFAWGLNVPTGDHETIALTPDQEWGMRTPGETFNIISLYDYVRDVMDLFAYHGPTNTWKTNTVWRSTSMTHNSGAYSYAYPARGDDLESVFFSGLHGNFKTTVFPDTPNPRIAHSDYLSYLLSDGGDGCLFDAHRDQMYERDLEFEYASLGEAVFVGADMATQTAWGYSAVSGSWTSAPVNDTPRVGESGRYIGWVADSWPSHKYLVFNGYYDCWVELDIGTTVGVATGGKTMLVYHNDTIWAFNPEAPVLSAEDPSNPDEGPISGNLPAVLSLYPVQPNPFNAATRITFDVPRTEHVRLVAYDVRGRKVSTLTNEVWSAGTHHLNWNGTSESGHSLSSGVYFLRLETDQTVITQRVTLVK